MGELKRVPPIERLQAPSAGEARRDAVKSLVDSVSTDLAKRIKSIHTTADTLEQTMLTSAARAKSILDEHVANCQILDEEATRLEAVLEKMTAQTTIEANGD